MLQPCALLLLAASVAAQTPPVESPQAPATPAQQAVQLFQQHRYDAAFTAFKSLIAANPSNVVYKKYASEAALSLGDDAYVLTTLLPVEVADPADWQARALLARAYAQTTSEPGHAQKRDEEVAAITAMHNQQPDSQLGKLRDFHLEDVHQGDKLIQFYPALTPWGPYKVHLIARTFDASGQPGLRITLESNDMEQPLFAKEHPKEAAAGKHSFSLDGYAPDQQSPDGHTVQTHYTFAILVGEPSYDDLRAKILSISSGALKPMSSSTHTIQ